MEATIYTRIAEQIQRIFSGGDSSEDSELELREILLLVEAAHNGLIKNGYYENIKAEGEHSVNGQFRTTLVKLPVLTDEDRGEKYVVLPTSYLALPGNKGVDQVTEWGKVATRSIIPVSPGFNALAAGTRTANMENHFGFYPEGDRLFFVNGTQRQFGIKNVNVRIIRGSAANVGPEQEMAIIGEVTKLLSVRRPQDKQNDGNPKAE